MTPKRIFFFWGNEKMSWLRYLTLYSFRKTNPDWEMVLFIANQHNIKKKTWVDNNEQDFHTFIGIDYMPQLPELGIEICDWELISPDNKSWDKKVCPSQKSNFFKWSELANEGGIYSDMDILYLCPMDSFYDIVVEYDMSIGFCDDYFSIGLMSSVPQNKFFEDVWRNTFKCWNPLCYQTAGVTNIYNLLNKGKPNIHNWRTLTERYLNLDIYQIPMSVVYPWRYNQMTEVFEKNHTTLPDDCLGIHWYAGCPLSQKYNNLLTLDNYKQHPSTLTTNIERILEC